jgi:hypothetical protein
MSARDINKHTLLILQGGRKKFFNFSLNTCLAAKRGVLSAAGSVAQAKTVCYGYGK